MLRKTFLLSIAQLLALSTAVSIPSPVVGDPEAEADRAEVAGIMKSKTGRSSHYYLFVTNEYSGDQLLRQSTCDIHAKSRKELWEGVSYLMTPKNCQIFLYFALSLATISVYSFLPLLLFVYRSFSY